MSTSPPTESEGSGLRKRRRLYHRGGKLSSAATTASTSCIPLVFCVITAFSLSYLPLNHGLVSPVWMRHDIMHRPIRPKFRDKCSNIIVPKRSSHSSKRSFLLFSTTPSTPDDSDHDHHGNNDSTGIPLHPPVDASSSSRTTSDRTDKKPTPKTSRLEEDIAKRLSVSRDRAVSALSQPPNDKDISSSSSSPPEAKPFQENSPRPINTKGYRTGANNKGETEQGSSSQSSVSSATGRGPSRIKNDSRRRAKREEKNRLSSLLPPPTQNFRDGGGTSTPSDDLSRGLTSWEDFLGDGAPSTSATGRRRQLKAEADKSSAPLQGEDGVQSGKRRGDNEESPLNNGEKLPSITDLFPPDLSTSIKNTKSPFAPDSPPPALDGVLPVSDLFYRSAQSMTEEDDDAADDFDPEYSESIVDPRSASARDDEELPFSAEQSDQLTSSQNRIKVRRNQARSAGGLGGSTPLPGQSTDGTPESKRRRGSGLNARLVRRGMEMLVGGTPVNADPPQRSIELMYERKEGTRWSEVITTNSCDFGPMLFKSSVGKLSKMEEALYCEFFVHYTLKWNVCPKDLRSLAKAHIATSPMGVVDSSVDDDENEVENTSLDLAGAGSLLTDRNGEILPADDSSQPLGTMKEFSSNGSREDSDATVDSNSVLGGELVFSIGVSKEELLSSDVPNERPIIERVLAKGITSATECSGFEVTFSKLNLSDLGDGSTMVSADFTLTTNDNESMTFAEIEKMRQRMNSLLARAMDDGAMQLAMAAAAKDEIAWPLPLRNRIVEEFLFDDDDLDCPSSTDEQEESSRANLDASTLAGPSDGPPSLDSVATPDDLTVNSLLRNIDYKTVGFGDEDDAEGPFGMPGILSYQKDDIFLGGGNDGVFWNYAESNANNAPFQGALGLRLVDAVTERSKQRMPRVIAVGDVHGCIDELQDLLRECDYRPGDLVVFLGDLVSKGPDSASVVQMAREIGAIAVRGNHDFEVVRWHQAIKSGVDPPVVGSEHFHIATCLAKADMKWLYSLPWYISSPDLGALFVHAGFVSGIRLAKQNPRLMMNMRSILPDGTVTSKFFNNWPWARLWDGPQTVLFGHDADRGLQQYEHAIGLDTGCVYGGRLTACILPEKRLVSVSARKEYFKYRRKHYD